METEMITKNENLPNYERIKQNWSKARTWTVASLYNDWRGKDQRIFIFEDNRLEGENLAMLKMKEFLKLEESFKRLTRELSENQKKIERYETLLEVIKGFVKKNNLEQNKEILEKILKLS